MSFRSGPLFISCSHLGSDQCTPLFLFPIFPAPSGPSGRSPTFPVPDLCLPRLVGWLQVCRAPGLSFSRLEDDALEAQLLLQTLIESSSEKLMKDLKILRSSLILQMGTGGSERGWGHELHRASRAGSCGSPASRLSTRPVAAPLPRAQDSFYSSTEQLPR